MRGSCSWGKSVKDFPNCHVNLIPVNGNEHIELYKPSITNMNTFKDIVSFLWRICNGTKRNGRCYPSRMWTIKVAHGRKKENS